MATRPLFLIKRMGLGLWPLLVLVLYLPSIRNGFVYDDLTLIVREQPPASTTDLARVFLERHFPTVPYYRPVTRLTFLLQRQWHGLNPVPYHLANALLAAFAAWAAFRLLRFPRFGIPLPAAMAAALLWAIHPIMSSAVYPICSGRESLLPATLSLLALDAWLRRRTFFALILFALTLFAREQAVALPLLFFTAEILGLRQPDAMNPSRVRQPVSVLPYAIMTLLIVGYVMIRRALFRGSDFQIALLENPWGPFFSLLYALQTFFFPFRILVYEPPLSLWWSWPRLLAALLLFAALVATAIRRRVGRPVLLFWTAWFVFLLAPTANILKQETPFDERYLLLSSLAFFAVGAATWNTLPDRIRCGLALAVFLFAALPWAALSLHRARYFQNDAVFAAHWVRVNPDSHNALINYAKYQIDAGNYEEAHRAAARAVELAPDLEYAWYNLGVALDRLGKTDEAVAAYRRALALKPIAEAHYNLGVALAARGRTEQAIRHYQAALEQNPRHADAHYNLGLLFAEHNRLSEAIPLFERAAKLDPRDGQSLYNLGVALERLGRPADAAAAYERALDRAPDHAGALFNLALIRYREQRHADAIPLLNRLLTLTPDDAEARALLKAANEALQKSP